MILSLGVVTLGSLPLKRPPIRSSAGDNPDTVWGVVRYWKRNFCNTLFQSFPSKVIILISKFLAQDNDFPAFWLVP